MNIATYLRRFFNGIRSLRSSGPTLIPSRFDGEGFEPIHPPLGAVSGVLGSQPYNPTATMTDFAIDLADVESLREHNWLPALGRPLTRWGRFMEWVRGKLRYIGVLPGYEGPNISREHLNQIKENK